MELSEDQIQDLMLVRKVCLIKRSLIAAERVHIMTSMQNQTPTLDITAALPINDNAEMSAMAERLKQNAAEDAQVVHRVSRALFCGVRNHESLGLTSSCIAIIDAAVTSFIV